MKPFFFGPPASCSGLPVKSSAMASHLLFLPCFRSPSSQASCQPMGKAQVGGKGLAFTTSVEHHPQGSISQFPLTPTHFVPILASQASSRKRNIFAALLLPSPETADLS